MNFQGLPVNNYSVLLHIYLKGIVRENGYKYQFWDFQSPGKELHWRILPRCILVS